MPAALIDSSGTVLERCEYDAYGNCSILEPNFAPDPDGKSDYGNPYWFTGRRLDILDNGSLKIQYNRNRYYDYYTGRWLTHDPLRYIDGMNLYIYSGNMPSQYVDPFGLWWWGWHCKDKCKKGDIRYEILDHIITPYHIQPTYKGAITDYEAAKFGLDMVTLARIIVLIHMGFAPEVIVAEIGIALVDKALVLAIDIMFKDFIKQLAEAGNESYLKVQIKKCKIERLSRFLWLCWRYNWKNDEVKYYQCRDGSVAEIGQYKDPEHAAENFDACEETFDRKFKGVKDNPEALKKLFYPNYLG